MIKVKYLLDNEFTIEELAVRTAVRYGMLKFVTYINSRSIALFIRFSLLRTTEQYLGLVVDRVDYFLISRALK